MTTDDHDAELHYKVPSVGYGPDWLISWWWTSGRWTMSPTEHEEMERLIKEAEDQVDENQLDSGDVVARIWMDGETVDRVDWTLPA